MEGNIFELGITELVGINEEVNTGDMSGSVACALAKESSGEIISVLLIATEDGSGAVQDSAGHLIFLDANPAVASGDTDLTAAEWLTVIGKVAVAQADWVTDANGGMVYYKDIHLPFHNLATIYAVWLHTDATDLNDAGGDDEQLEFNMWYRLDK